MRLRNINTARFNLSSQSRGDTLVEVLLATVVISIVLAGAFSMSVRALRFNQAATERTEVVNKMREQTEMLRYLNENRSVYTAAWNQIETYAATGTPFYLTIYVGNDPSAGVEDPLAAGSGYVQAYTPGSDTYGALDIFDIRILPNPGPAGQEYIDFTTYATWDGIGDQGPQRSGSVLRLNTGTF